MRYEYITKIEIKFDKKKTFKRKSIKYLQKIIFQESVKLPSLFPHVDAYVRSGLLSEWKDIANHLELIEHMAPQHNAESMIEIHRRAFRC